MRTPLEKYPLPFGNLLIASLLVCLSTVAFAIDVVPQRQAGAKQRNVIFILSDDHRYDAMGFMGHPFLETPHMDSIAKNGVHLKNAFVTTSLCSPSRASILTGLYTHKHRVIDNNRLVPDGTRFFPEWLQKAGYSTAYIGKWHMGGDSDEPLLRSHQAKPCLTRTTKANLVGCEIRETAGTESIFPITVAWMWNGITNGTASRYLLWTTVWGGWFPNSRKWEFMMKPW